MKFETRLALTIICSALLLGDSSQVINRTKSPGTMDINFGGEDPISVPLSKYYDFSAVNSNYLEIVLPQQPKLKATFMHVNSEISDSRLQNNL